MHTSYQPRLNQVIREGRRQIRLGGFSGFCRGQIDMFVTQIQSRGFSYNTFQKRTDHCTSPLRSTADLISYNALYAGHHYVAFSNLLSQHTYLNDFPNLKVIDYGCGQGLASLALLEHIAPLSTPVELHLVEPSYHALTSAHAYTAAMASRTDANLAIQTHQCKLNQLPDSVFKGSSHTVTLHLFSNVLDIASRGTLHLSGLFHQVGQAPGLHACLAASPVYASAGQGYTQLSHFFPHATHHQCSQASLRADNTNYPTRELFNKDRGQIHRQQALISFRNNSSEVAA